MNDERIAYLTLTQVPGMGSVRLKNLLAVCSTALGAHSAPIAFLCTVPGVSRALATALKATPLETGRATLEHAARLGARVLLPDDVEYPALLRPIPRGSASTPSMATTPTSIAPPSARKNNPTIPFRSKLTPSAAFCWRPIYSTAIPWASGSRMR